MDNNVYKYEWQIREEAIEWSKKINTLYESFLKGSDVSKPLFLVLRQI